MSRILLIVGIVFALWYFWRSLKARAGLSLAEARQLLDLPEDADADMIRAAHRRLIAKVHPDAGGSEELARQVNQARDLLLKQALSRREP